MPPRTTRHSPKLWNWSYSKLKNFEACPKRHYHVGIARDFKEADGEALLWGNAAHKALADTLSGAAALPQQFAKYQAWADKVKIIPGELMVEQKYALTEGLTATGFFDADVWFRGIADILVVRDRVAIAIDWKTGRILEDSVQLALMAQCVFAHHPEVEAVRTEFVWLKENASTREDFYRADMPGLWAGLLPRISAMKLCAEQNNYPEKPGYLCKRFCPVTSCTYHG